MDKDKLLALRQKKLQAKNAQHKELLKAQEQVRNEIKALGEFISGASFDWDKFKNHINELGEVLNLHNDVKVLSTALEKVHKDALNSKDLDIIVNAVNAQNNNDIIESINSLKKSLQKNAPDQKPEDFIPTRRVIKVGSVLQFDDKPTSSGGVGGGGGVQPALTRNGNSIAVVNPDGTPISAGGGGGGDATAAKQDEQTALLQQIEDNTANIEINADSINLNTDEIEAKLDEQTTELIQANAYLAGTVNQESTQQLIQSDLGTVIGSINPGGFASANKQDEEITLLTQIEANQLPNNHDVTVSNQVDQPLTDDQLRATPVPVSVSGDITIDEPVTVEATNLDIRDLAFATDKVDTSGSTVALDAPTLAALETTTVNKGTGWVDPQTDALTNTQLRASPVPISGTTTANKGTGWVDPQTDALTNTQLRASDVKITLDGEQVAISNFPATQTVEDNHQTNLLAYANQISASTSITPTSGKAIQLVWCQIIADPDNSSGNLVTIAFNGDPAIYKAYSLGRTAVFTGDVDQPLDITLETSENVTINIQYREV